MSYSYERTLYTIQKITKASRITPYLSENIRNIKGELMQMVICEYDNGEKKDKETFNLGELNIVPVEKNDSRNFCIEKGYYTRVTLDSNYHVISRGNPIYTSKLYINFEFFCSLLEEFKNMK